LSGLIKHILGVDPGLHHTGWAIISEQGNKMGFVSSGTIKTNPKDGLPTRLKNISNGLNEALANFDISTAAIEETFVNKNSLSSLKLGHARGAIIVTLANMDLDISEYSTTHIKKAVAGTGRADKNQIEVMVKMLLPTAKPNNDHEADAIAIAICHANNQGYNGYIRNAS